MCKALLQSLSEDLCPHEAKKGKPTIHIIDNRIDNR